MFSFARPQGNRGQYPTFCGTVQLGDDQAAQSQCFVKCFDLRQGVLTGIAVDDQQYFVRRSRFCLLYDAMDFFQFIHQMQLGRQTACSIDKHHVFCARFACGDCIKTYRRRVAIFLADNFHLIAVCPNHQLLFGGCAKRIRCRQQHAGAGIVQMPCQLADGSGFACAIDAGNHHHSGTMLGNIQFALKWLE